MNITAGLGLTRAFRLVLLAAIATFSAAPTAAQNMGHANSATAASWLLLVFTAGGGTTTQIGPPWANEASCKAAKEAVDAFMLRQSGNALVDGTRSAKSESECVSIGSSNAASQINP